MLHRPLQLQGIDQLRLGPADLKVCAKVKGIPAVGLLAEPLDLGAVAATPEEVVQEVLQSGWGKGRESVFTPLQKLQGKTWVVVWESPALGKGTGFQAVEELIVERTPGRIKEVNVRPAVVVLDVFYADRTGASKKGMTPDAGSSFVKCVSFSHGRGRYSFCFA